VKKRARQPDPKDVASTERSPEPAGEPTLQIVRANINREVFVAPGFVSLYTNDTQVQMTPWDFRITFGEISQAPTVERPNVQVKTTGEVRMSPQHAKKFAETLMKQVQFYESNVGMIPMPSD
jgi:hypothetical protein